MSTGSSSTSEPSVAESSAFEGKVSDTGGLLGETRKYLGKRGWYSAGDGRQSKRSEYALEPV